MRQRVLRPQWWDSHHRARLSELEEVLWLSCIGHADDKGRSKGDPYYFKRKVFWNRNSVTTEMIEAMLEHLGLNKRNEPDAQHEGMIARYVVGGTPYVQVIKFLRYQYIQWPSASSLPPPPSEIEKLVAAAGTCKKEGREGERTRGPRLAFKGERLRVPMWLAEELESSAGNLAGDLALPEFLAALDAELVESGEAIPDELSFVRQRVRDHMVRLKREKSRRSEGRARGSDGERKSVRRAATGGSREADDDKLVASGGRPRWRPGQKKPINR